MRNTAANNTKSVVEVLAFGHCYSEGERGAQGGAPSNDKVWGIARIDGKLVTFNARRLGKLSFKTAFGHELPKLEAKFREKQDVTRKDAYVAVKSPAMINTLWPTLNADLVHDFYSKMSRGMLNTRH